MASRKRKAVSAGSFDPATNGRLYMIRECARPHYRVSGDAGFALDVK